jgi:hypothetical protein
MTQQHHFQHNAKEEAHDDAEQNKTKTPIFFTHSHFALLHHFYSTLGGVSNV